MRQAAGIMLVIFGMLLLNTLVSALRGYDIHVYEIVSNLLMIIPVGFLITGGIFCLQKKYWKVCLASAWFAVLIMILWLTGSHPDAFLWLSWVFSILGTLSIIFVYLTKEEWKEIQS
jgi:hypothetical protein